MTLSVILAVEDILSEALARQVLNVCQVSVAQTIGLRGAGYLRTKAPSLNKTALGYPVVMVTDLDSRKRCPLQLIQSWIGAYPNPNFVFRVAVMEIESWLLADRQAFSRFSGLATERIPPDPDSIADPKQFLVNLVRKSKDASIRHDIVPKAGSTAIVGPAYNLRLSQFIDSDWRAKTAANASRSLRRAIAALNRLGERIR